ncbi:AraC family transcriptional regulator [Spongiivirga sp. MCCC 1A20706]|uniref:helix-turn-helix domain-containing protein n=1 Tax=Spongiivirga sp. MCCC 1A20706 TaxID=3160963 RepID=UPI003977D5BE
MIKTIFDFAIIAGSIIGYFIGIALLTVTFYKGRANKYLAASLFLQSTITFAGWFDLDNFVFEFILNITLEFLFAATLFTYFLIQIKHEYLTKKWFKWLYAPFILSVGIECYFITSSIFGFYSEHFDTLIYYLKDSTSFLFNVILIFWGRILIKKSSAVSKMEKRWLLRFNFYIFCLILIWLVSKIEFYLFDSDHIIDFLLIIVSLFSWWVLYNGIFKLQVAIQKNELHDYLVAQGSINTRPKKKVNETTVSKISAQLYALMDEEELYKNPLLSRSELATRLGTSEVYLSQILNQEMNKSLSQFVNEYRIDAAKNLLHNPVFNKYSVESIGLEAGFKSKSAFYSTFRTHMGISPGAYRKGKQTS